MKELNNLLETMKLLRDPETGCPWDSVQTIESIRSHTIEEVYELVDAIERNDMNDLRDELGDVLFHIVFYCEMANENNCFNFTDVANGVNEKLKRRHPHVFSKQKTKDVKQLKQVWEQIKQQERDEKPIKHENFLDDISSYMPAILRAKKLQKRASSVGFDWNDKNKVFSKLEEEFEELRQVVLERNSCMERIEEELGDVMFCCVNLARHCNIDPELTLRKCNDKFVKRFNYIENTLKSKNKTLSNATLEQMDELWEEAKHKKN